MQTDAASSVLAFPAPPAELRPAVVSEYERALHAIFTAGAERRCRLRDAAASALDFAFERCGWAVGGLRM